MPFATPILGRVIALQYLVGMAAIARQVSDLIWQWKKPRKLFHPKSVFQVLIYPFLAVKVKSKLTIKSRMKGEPSRYSQRLWNLTRSKVKKALVSCILDKEPAELSVVMSHSVFCFKFFSKESLCTSGHWQQNSVRCYSASFLNHLNVLTVSFLLFSSLLLVCQQGAYGSGCTHVCQCLNGATCSPFNGSCYCSSGWEGANCQISTATNGSGMVQPDIKKYNKSKKNNQFWKFRQKDSPLVQ